MFDSIVVGIDGTDWGFEALRQALVLAPDTADVRAVTALDTAPAFHTGILSAHFAEGLANEAAEVRATAQAIIGGRPHADARVCGGKPVDVLRRERDDLDADLLALGGRRSSRFLGIMLGDTATELVHDGRCSHLLACPSARGTWHPGRIVVGLDGSSYALEALKVAEELAGRLGGSVEVVCATGGQGDVARDAAWATRVRCWDEAEPVHALVARSRSADLVVVGSRGLHGIRAIGSVSERVAHQAHCTTLVVHRPPKEP